MTRLTVTKKADRATMVAQLTALAESLGATVTVERREGESDYFKRETRLKLSVPGGAYLPVSIDGDSPHRPDPNVFVCCWNTDCDSLFAFSGRMGDVNQFHFSKSQRVCHGFDDLCDTLREDIPTLLSGDGYSAERARKLAEGRRKSLMGARDHYAPLVAAGLGTTWTDGSECASPEAVRAKFESIPAKLSQIDAFIAAGCPLQDCSSIPQLPLF